jgi:ABC-type glycerol-3-phosphate transport system substrate-binding protein
MVDQAEKAATFNSAAGVATLRYWRDLVAKGYMPLYGNDFFTAVADGFTRGDVAMYLGSASSYDGLAKKAGFRVRLAPMPVPDAHQQLVPLSTNGFVMLATDPARQRATCGALLSLLRPDAVTDTVKATATIPLNTAAATGDQYLAGYLRDRPDLRMINSQPSFSWYALPGRANAEYQAAYTDTQNLVLRGAVDPQKGLDDLAARTTPLLTADAQGPR